MSQRAADAYIDTEAMRLTAWQAAWRLDAGVPAAEQVAIAKFWASEGGADVSCTPRTTSTAAMGVDRDYPLYRYFLLAKQLELVARLGDAVAACASGGLLADTPVG